MFTSRMRTFNVLKQNSTILSKRFQSTAPKVVAPVKKTSIFKPIFYGSLLAATAAVGYGIYGLYKEQHPSALPVVDANSNKKKLVILGTGWASITLLKSIDTSLYDITIISPRDHFLFTPLLPSAPVSTVAVESIKEDVSTLIRQGSGRVTFLQKEALDVDPENKKVIVEGDKAVDYDILVFSVGAQPNTFGIPGVYENALFMKEANDAVILKAKLKENLQKATELPAGSQERKDLLSMIVVGGGPTGVETAAELQDYVSEEVAKWNPELAADCQIHLVEGLGNILGMFDQKMYTLAQDHLKKNGVALKLNAMAQKVVGNTITVKDSKTQELVDMNFGILIWATGNGTRPVTANLMNKLPETQNNRRGLLINQKLELLGAEGSIYALGDCTFHKGLVPTAQVAHQEGEYLAKVLETRHIIDNTDNEAVKASLAKTIQDFEYFNQGALCYIGGEAAINDIKLSKKIGFKLGDSFLSFKVWQGAYLAMAVTWRTRFLIACDWIKVHIVGRQ
ncbi:hypothetical protein FOG51_01470 [Hanseniaspora uvarum]|nr:hypothetical protein FOG51_01470 [Hanseniaspora uvarum]KAF0277489.1 hypothetical protein FOG50_01644 [Hanseniaspora uvarum]